MILTAALAGCNRQPAGPPSGQGMPPTPVTLAAARTTPIADNSEYVGSLKSPLAYQGANDGEACPPGLGKQSLICQETLDFEG